jgi:hypothetical protein
MVHHSIMPAAMLLLAVLLAACPAQPCGDCDDDGAGPDLADALVAARISVGLVSPTGRQLVLCDVDASTSILTTDALVIAQLAAGLPGVPVHCRAPGPPSCAIVAPAPGPVANPVTVQVEVDDPEGDPVDVTLHTVLGGAPFHAFPAPGSPMHNPARGVQVPAILTFEIDLGAGFPCAAAAGFDLQVVVEDWHERSQCTSAGYTTTAGVAPVVGSLPVDPGSVVFVVDRSLGLGWGTSLLPVPGLPGATPWHGVQQAVTRALECLDPATRFGLVLFDQPLEVWQPDLVPATSANVAAASGWLSWQNPVGGITYPPAIGAALALGGGPPDQILLISSGDAYWGLAEVATVTTLVAGQCRVDTVVCKEPATPLGWQIMRDLAAQNGGAAVP